MQPLQGDHNKSHPGSLTALIQAHWSQHRCWHGEDVTISVRSSRVSDSAQLDLAIVPEGNEQNPLETISDKKVSSSKLDHKYTVNWKEKPFGENRKFVIQATVEKKLKAPLSPVLYVDLEPPIFSA